MVTRERAHGGPTAKRVPLADARPVLDRLFGPPQFLAHIGESQLNARARGGIPKRPQREAVRAVRSLQRVKGTTMRKLRKLPTPRADIR